MNGSTFNKLLTAVGLVMAISGTQYVANAQAPTWRGVTGRITQYGVGWNANSAYVALDVPAPAGTGCTDTSFYVTDPANPGNAAYMSTLHGAFLSGRSVEIIVDGCSAGGRPKIIGVRAFR